MLGENGYPETPDWLPESRDGNIRLRVAERLDEALRLWDGNWATWAGDQA